MGFFSKIFSGSEPQPFTITKEPQAYAAILLACVNIDGDISDEESSALFFLLHGRRLFEGYDIPELISVAISNFRKAGGSSALLEAAVGAITDKTRRSLFVCCVDAILSDGVVTKEEEDVLEFLKSKLGIDDAFAEQCVTVLLAKNEC